MRLLICTQAVDSEDPVLSFFIDWIRELAQRVEEVHVICLKEGAHDLPANVRVYSLGKEKGERAPLDRFTRRLRYASRFLALAWKLRNEYDAVFVHQNQEYVLLGGALWEILGRPVYLWRNHYKGTVLTRIALAWCSKIFYTSKFSFTARHPRAAQLPVGVDTDRFRVDPAVVRTPRSILFLARMAPSKRPDVLMSALEELAHNGVAFRATFVGDPLPHNRAYYDAIKTRAGRSGVAGTVEFLPGAPNEKTPAIYGAHDLFVNLSSSGMYDKTIFEAAACGCLVLATSRDFAEHVDPRLVFSDDAAHALATKLQGLLALVPSERTLMTHKLQAFAQQHSLRTLATRLVREMKV